MSNQNDLKKMYRTAVDADFPNFLSVELEKEAELRYGENPNQPAAMYRFKGTTLAEFTDIQLLKSGKGGLSATNYMDVTRALDILKFFKKPSCAVMKHTIPSGFATTHQEDTQTSIYIKARDADARSAFGSVVVFNTPVDVQCAKELSASFVEAVAAPSFAQEAQELLSEKKNIRLVTFKNLDMIPKFEGDDTKGLFDFKVLPSARVVVQKPFLTKITGKDALILQPQIADKEGTEHKVKRAPTQNELDDLLTAWYINIGVRSNGIVIVKDGVTIAVGSGQQERVGAVEQAIQKSYQKAMDRENIEYTEQNVMLMKEKLKQNPLKGAVLASDGFYPFRDSIDLLARHRITATIQPGGSVKDAQVIDGANDRDMAMVFTTERCFAHF